MFEPWNIDNVISFIICTVENIFAVSYKPYLPQSDLSLLATHEGSVWKYFEIIWFLESRFICIQVGIKHFLFKIFKIWLIGCNDNISHYSFEFMLFLSKVKNQVFSFVLMVFCFVKLCSLWLNEWWGCATLSVVVWATVMSETQFSTS